MASSDAQQETNDEKRRRGATDGRIVVNCGTLFGQYICDQSEELGISPATVARILINEAITKYRGISKERLKEMYEKEAEEPVATPA